MTITVTGKRVPIVLDPVLLLEAERWRKVAKKPRNMPKGPYTLVYSVESMSEELKNAVEKEKKDETKKEKVEYLEDFINEEDLKYVSAYLDKRHSKTNSLLKMIFTTKNCDFIYCFMGALYRLKNSVVDCLD